MDSLLTKPDLSSNNPADTPLDEDSMMKMDVDEENKDEKHVISEQSITRETFDSFDIFKSSEYGMLANQLSSVTLC